MRAYLDFEKPVAALEARIDELRSVEMPNGGELSEEIGRLETRASCLSMLALVMPST